MSFGTVFQCIFMLSKKKNKDYLYSLSKSNLVLINSEIRSSMTETTNVRSVIDEI